MSRLNELINELCPNGVEFKPLLSVADILYGYPCNASLFNSDGKGLPLVRIRDVLSGQTDTYTTEKVPDKYMLSYGDLLVGMDGNFHVANWKTDSGVLCQRVCKVSSSDETILLNGFISHWLKLEIKQIEESKKGGTVKHLLNKDIKAISIPVPPIEIQREIVRVLDSFTLFATELTEQLVAELTARKRQYEFYRDKLLTFDCSIRKMTLGSVATIVRGASPRPIKNYITERDGVNWIKIGDVEQKSKYITSCKEKITYDGAKKSRYVKSGDFLLSNSMSFGRPYILKIDGCVHDGWLVISKFEKYVTADYLYYVLTSSVIQKEMAQKASFGGAVQNLNADIVRGIEIFVPSFEIQNKIVDVLDNFDSICSDLNIGLPAEIEARKKQYEYYRDKLLSFKELE